MNKLAEQAQAAYKTFMEEITTEEENKALELIDSIFGKNSLKYFECFNGYLRLKGTNLYLRLKPGSEVKCFDSFGFRQSSNSTYSLNVVVKDLVSLGRALDRTT